MTLLRLPADDLDNLSWMNWTGVDDAEVSSANLVSRRGTANLWIYLQTTGDSVGI